MDNTVIKVLNRDHGRKVINFFKSKGVNTGNHQGLRSEEDGFSDMYYGIIEGIFTNYRLTYVNACNAKIITLPEDNPYPKVMLVSNSDDKAKGKRRVVFMEKNDNYIAWAWAETLEDAEKRLSTCRWSYAWDIEEEEIVELTIQDISDGKGTGIPPHLIRVKK